MLHVVDPEDAAPDWLALVVLQDDLTTCGDPVVQERNNFDKAAFELLVFEQPAGSWVAPVMLGHEPQHDSLIQSGRGRVDESELAPVEEASEPESVDDLLFEIARVAVEYAPVGVAAKVLGLE